MMTEFKSKFPMKVCNSTVFEDSIWYVFHCDCGSHDHAATIEIEYDKKLNLISLNFYKDFEYFNWSDGYLDKVINCWKRFKTAMRILFVGYIEVNADMIINGTDHVDAFIDALIEGRNYVAVKEERRKKNEN